MINKFAATCHKCAKLVAAGAGNTNLIEGKWQTEHKSTEQCYSAVKVNFSTPRQYFNSHAMNSWQDYYDDDDNPYGPFSTSEDVNPLEGCK